jgi:hypothetical protein
MPSTPTDYRRRVLFVYRPAVGRGSVPDAVALAALSHARTARARTVGRGSVPDVFPLDMHSRRQSVPRSLAHLERTFHA